MVIEAHAKKIMKLIIDAHENKIVKMIVDDFSPRYDNIAT